MQGPPPRCRSHNAWEREEQHKPYGRGHTLAACASSKPACSACAARAETSGSRTRTRSRALLLAAATADSSASSPTHCSSFAATCGKRHSLVRFPPKFTQTNPTFCRKTCGNARVN